MFWHLRFQLFFLILRSVPSRLLMGPMHCAQDHYLLTCKISGGLCSLVDLMYCLRDLQTPFFTQTLIKNRFHDTIYTFKNYFITVFLIFNF